jgi:formate dehydrogenase subunit gamma
MPFPTWSEDEARDVLSLLLDEPGPVLLALQGINSHFGYVPSQAIALIASVFNVSRADVHGVLTFYHDLRSVQSPRNSIRICVAEACQSVGSRELVSAAEAKFQVKIDTKQAENEILAAYCFGNCALGPTAMVNGELIGRTDIEKIMKALI